MTISQLLTWSHHFGTNILGLLLIGIEVGMFLLADAFAEVGSRVLFGVLFLASFMLVSGCDLLWRYRSEPRRSFWRFVFPSSGGAILVVPIWLLVLAPPVAVVFLVTTNWLKRFLT